MKTEKNQNGWICFVFDDRVSINKKLIGTISVLRLQKSNYKMTQSYSLQKGVSCHYCIKERTIKQIQSSQTRQDQINWQS